MIFSTIFAKIELIAWNMRILNSLYVLWEVLVDNGIVEAPDYVKEDSAEQSVYSEKPDRKAMQNAK